MSEANAKLPTGTLRDYGLGVNFAIFFSNSLILYKSTTNHCMYTTSRAFIWIPNDKLDENL